MRFLLLFTLLTPLVFADPSSQPYDCKNFKEFVPLDILNAEVTVVRLFKLSQDGSGLPVEEEICKTTVPLSIPVKDIREKEADWYYCDTPNPTAILTCDTSYKGKIAKLEIKPAVVIRKAKPNDAIDIHMHVTLTPENDLSRQLDSFSQWLVYDLGIREMTLNGGTGGHGANADQDYHYVRVKFSR